MLPKVFKQNGGHELLMNTYVIVGQRYYWRASETLSGVYKFELVGICIYIYLLVMSSYSTDNLAHLT